MSSSSDPPGALPSPKRALILVDVQRDFCLPNGALPVPDGSAVVPVIAAVRKQSATCFSAGVFAAQDWHPPKHASFASTHGLPPFSELDGLTLWPDHCVQGTDGARLADGLEVEGLEVVRKGSDLRYDSYSSFQDDGGVDTVLAERLKARNVDEVYVCGVATEFCVKFTVMHALERGFRVYLILDAIVGLGFIGGLLTVKLSVRRNTERRPRWCQTEEVLTYFVFLSSAV